MTVAKFPKGRVLTALNAEVTTATIAITTMVIDLVAPLFDLPHLYIAV